MLRSNRTGESALPQASFRTFFSGRHIGSPVSTIQLGECNAIINRCFGECDLTCQHSHPCGELCMDRRENSGVDIGSRRFAHERVDLEMQLMKIQTEERLARAVLEEPEDSLKQKK